MPANWTWSDSRLRQGGHQIDNGAYVGVMTIWVLLDLLVCVAFSSVAVTIASSGVASLLAVCAAALSVVVVGSGMNPRGDALVAFTSLAMVSIGVCSLLTIGFGLVSAYDFRTSILIAAGCSTAIGVVFGLCMPEESPAWWQNASRWFGLGAGIVVFFILGLFDINDLAAIARDVPTAFFVGWVARTMALGMSLVRTSSNSTVVPMAIFRDLVYYAEQVIFGDRRRPRF